MWKKDGVKFMGRMPAGMKIGDPRYNIINWDNVAEAGAAYESQAADPETGIQSHSLIYLPLAWVNIGKQYWANGQFADGVEQGVDRLTEALGKRRFLGEKLPVHCIESATSQLAFNGKVTPEEFAQELLKSVLFHEVGHAFGLDHNFKGSLSYESESPTSMFSTSIMDYNHYSIERSAFDTIESSNGPLLEYDRQIMSALYNNGSDIKESDPVVPACNDEETDSLVSGIDPLCIRYDAGSDPTKHVLKALALVTDPAATSEGQVSLPNALLKSVADLGDAATVSTAEELTARVSKLNISLKGILNYYFNSGAQSLRYMTQANIRSVYIFKDGILPDGMSEEGLRDRALQAVEAVAAMDALPKATKDSFNATIEKTREWMLTTPFVKSLPETDQVHVLGENIQSISLVASTAESATGTLSSMRGKVLGNLKRVTTAPFYMGPFRGVQSDMEQVVLNLLEKSLSPTTPSSSQRGAAERTATATALATFLDIPAGQEVAKRVVEALRKEEGEATNAVAREEIRALIALLP
jgi:hypothetical protein